MLVRPCSSIPSSIITARRRSASGRFISSPQLLAGALHERARHRRLRSRAGVLLDPPADRLLNTPILAGRHTGQHPLQHHALELVALSEMLVGLQAAPLPRRPPSGPAGAQPQHAARRASPRRPRDHDGPRCVPGCACPSARRPRSTSASSNSRSTPSPTSTDSASSPSLAAPTSCPSASCTRSGSTASSLIASATGTFALHGGSSFDLDRIAHHAPTKSGRAGGTAVTSKFYEPRDNL